MRVNAVDCCFSFYYCHLSQAILLQSKNPKSMAWKVADSIVETHLLVYD